MSAGGRAFAQPQTFRQRAEALAARAARRGALALHEWSPTVARALADALEQRNTRRRTGRRSYDGAAVGRRTDGWISTGSSANAELYLARGLLRDRARDLVRNNHYASRIVRGLAIDLVGSGIRPRPDTGSDARDRLLEELWAEWEPQVDTATELGFYGVQMLAARAMFESGEVLVRFRPRRTADVSVGRRLAVPLQLQPLESDFLDWTRNQSPLSDGGRIVQGVEFDPIDRRRAYWLYRYHPGDAFAANLGAQALSNAVPAAEVLHMFEAQRPGQVRGVPWLAPVIRALRDLDDYRDAERMRKKLEACSVAFVTIDDPAEEGINVDGSERGVENLVTDTLGQPLELMEPGMIHILRNGKQVSFHAPATVGGYGEYLATELSGISAGVAAPYEDVTHDLSRVSYVSGRLGRLNKHRMMKAIQEQVFVPLLCQPVWRRFADTAIASGAIEDGETRAVWHAPRLEEVDPEKAARAQILRVRSGLTSLPRAVAEDGAVLDDLLAETAATNKKLDKLGIVLDSDPRRTATSGTAQKAEEAPAADRMSRALDALEEGDTEAARAYLAEALAADVLSTPPLRRASAAAAAVTDRT